MLGQLVVLLLIPFELFALPTVPGLRVELELQLPAYTTDTAIATPDLSRICDLNRSLWQCQILKP